VPGTVTGPFVSPFCFRPENLEVQIRSQRLWWFLFRFFDGPWLHACGVVTQNKGLKDTETLPDNKHFGGRVPFLCCWCENGDLLFSLLAAFVPSFPFIFSELSSLECLQLWWFLFCYVVLVCG